MDDLKRKSISELTDAELSKFNNRLDMELEIERLLLRIKSNSGERPLDGIDERLTVNTTTPISQLYHSELKDKSISELSMVELGQLLVRLQLELRAQDKILDLKRNSSSEPLDWENRPAVDVTTPINQLYHYGVLGMKWGVRKQRDSVGRRRSGVKAKPKTTESEKPKSEDYKDSRVLKSKAHEGLSNADLKRLNDRLNLEKQYRDLTKAEQQMGKNFLSDSISSGLKQTVSTVVAASSLYAVKKLIEKSMGSEAAADMFPKKK